MSEGDDDHWRGVLEDTHDAVIKYAKVELAGLARKTIYWLRRLSAVGIYEEYRFKTIWDEYCHIVHRDTDPTHDWAWDETIDSFVDHALAKLPRQVGLLL